MVIEAPVPLCPNPESGIGFEYLIMRLFTYLEGVPSFVEPTEEAWRSAEEYLGRQLGRQYENTQEELLIQKELLDEADSRGFWTHPEPGTAFTYEDWKVSRNVHKAVVNPIVQRLEHDRAKAVTKLENNFVNTMYEAPTHDRYDVCLEESFRESGLQLIVKTGIIHAKPAHGSMTGWRVDGHMNEHIVGVACYMYDIDNVACMLSFAQEVDMSADAYRYQGDRRYRCVKDDLASYEYNGLYYYKDVNALAAVLGFENGRVLPWTENGNDELPVEQTGSVRMPQGRLITFPSILEYNLEATLVDSKLGSGHASYVFIYLVDPNYRICSTSNVPPQQQAWWSMSIGDLQSKNSLPPELVDHVLCYYEAPVSHERAQEHRQAMVQEDTWLEVARYVGMDASNFD